MIIPIDDNQRVKSTELCWQLERRHVPGPNATKREVTWKPVGYYSSFYKALQDALNREIRQHPAYGVKEAIQACEELTEKYQRLYDREIRAVSKMEAA